jgi:hypothetical protein
MDNKEEVFVVLLIKYDPQLIDHPKWWDWKTLIENQSDDVQLVETFYNVFDEGTVPSPDSPSN